MFGGINNTALTSEIQEFSWAGTDKEEVLRYAANVFGLFKPWGFIRERVFWLLRSIYATASLLKFARAKTSRPVLNAGSQWKEGLQGEDGKAVTSPVLIGRGGPAVAFAYANDR